MSYALTWLPDVLLGAGLKVGRCDGWENAGVADMGQLAGVMCHHTAGPRSGNMPSLRTLQEGRPDLRGPLAQLGLGRDGSFYIVAAGRCNHAGVGNWDGNTLGNSSFIAIEAENSGHFDDPWPKVQIDAYVAGVAAILRRLGLQERACVGHKEYALPHGRKPDPSFDMVRFRVAVKRLLDNELVAVPQIPAYTEPSDANGGRRPTVRRGSTGEYVLMIQRFLGLAADGIFGGDTDAAVRELQRRNGLVPDAIVGPRTWRAVDHLASLTSAVN